MKKLKDVFERWACLGTGQQADPLTRTRQKTFNVFCGLFILTVSLLVLTRIFQGQFWIPVSSSISILLVGFAVFLSARGHFQCASALGATTIVTICYVQISNGWVPSDRVLPQLTMSMALFIFVIPKMPGRLVFVAYCLVLIGHLLVLDGKEPVDVAMFLLQMIFMAIAFYYLVHFAEQQDSRLRMSMERLEDSSRTIEIANTKLSHRNEELVSFAHIMSHDLKAPLTSIQTASDLLAMENEAQENDGMLELLNYIQRATGSMNHLITDLLQYCKLNASGEIPFARVDLNELVRETVHPFELDVRRGAIKLEIGPLPVIQGNAVTLRTVFHNLIANGFKYQPKERAGHVPTVTIWHKHEEDWHLIYVKDNGIGIHDDFIDDLFTPFRRGANLEAYRGTGLGLSMCKSVVLNHRGFIELADTGPTGSTFLVRLPVMKGEPPSPAPTV